MAGTLLGRGAQYDVPLDNDLLMKISVVDSVASIAASSTDKRLEGAFADIRTSPPITIKQGAQHQLDLARQFMERCPCHTAEQELGSVWLWTGRRPVAGDFYSPRTGVMPARAQFLEHSADANIVDEQYLCLPFLCTSGLESGDYFITSIVQGPAIVIPDREHRVLQAHPAMGHHFGCRRGDLFDQSLNRDSLGYFYDTVGLYKVQLFSNPMFCAHCRPESHHGMSPLALISPLVPNSCAVGRSIMKAAWTAGRVIHAAVPRVSRVHITAWDSDYCPIEDVINPPTLSFVITCRVEDSQAVAARGQIPLQVYLYGSSRTLGNARLWVAAALPVGTEVWITNATLTAIGYMDQSVPMVAPVEAMGYSLRAPIFCSLLMVAGCTRVPQYMSLTRAGWLMNYYGLEESVLLCSTTIVTRVDHFLHHMITPWTILPAYVRPTPLVMRALGKTDEFWVAKGLRRVHTITLYRMVQARSRRTATDMTWTAALTLPLGVWSDPGPLPIYSTPQRAQRSGGTVSTLSGAIGADIGIVNWCVFGSLGDRRTVMASARRLAGWGIQVAVYQTHTDAEGETMLGHAERGQIMVSAGLFARCLAAVTSAEGLRFGPPEFTAVDVGVDLRPPSDVIQPVDFGVGAFANFLIGAALRGWTPTFHIGAYPGLFWLPRSADGETFLAQFVPPVFHRRSVAIMLAWGSSSLPKPVIEGAVEVLPGDHYAQFTNASVVVCHGGAGTVQTAAAAGARVISGTVVLDRHYRDPMNAGSGVKCGADPDKIILPLMVHSPKVLVWAYRHSWKMAWDGLRWFLHWQFYPSLWLMLALTVRSVVLVLRAPRIRLVMTTSLPATLIATSITSLVPPLVAVLLAPYLELGVMYVLEMSGTTYTAMILQVLAVMAQASLSPTTWAMMFAGAGWWTLPASWVMTRLQVFPVVAAEIIAALAPPTSIQGEPDCAFVGVSWAFKEYIPAFHTRFVNRDRTAVVEGVWVAGVRGVGQLYSIKLAPYRDIGPEWLLPTSLPWPSLVAMPEVVAPYSPLWNCQSGMLFVTRGMWGMLGLGLLFMAPVGVFMLLAMGCATLVLTFGMLLTEAIPMTTMVCTMIGKPQYVNHTRAWLYHMLTAFSARPDTWFASTMMMVVGMGTGWGAGSKADNGLRQLERVFTANTGAELNAVLADLMDEQADVTALNMLRLKAELLASRREAWDEAPYI